MWPLMSHVVTLFNCTPIFESSMIRLVVTNGHQKYTCNNEIGLCARNTLIILRSLINISRRVRGGGGGGGGGPL
jgi:hypothetical protein